ncbi:MAG TPA: sigma-54 dependent transcriptional regulator [Verrucomicrobiota bacterium]|nr:sigma-54 dependent transcriptional regulator [Verrucomicrobiota bacterium]
MFDDSQRSERWRLLIVDDEPGVRRLLEDIFKSRGHEVVLLGDAASLKQSFAGPPPDVVLLDLRLPDADGLDLLPQLIETWPDARIVMLTGYGTIDTAVEAVKKGAFYFVQKPFEPEALLLLVQRACEEKHLQEQNAALRRVMSALTSGAAPVFHSQAMQAILRTVERIAPSDVSVLITGESGTGKEVVADLIHALSNRSKGPMVKVNCAALPRELIESELFGAVRGAYTGAHSDREGLFRQAEGGSLLLDEISEMPIDTQTKLLRVLQEKEVRPVGGRTVYKVNCRIIAATNRRIEDAFREHKLREDLYYRIGAVRIDLPPLRDRKDDIVPLAKAFLKRFASQAGCNVAEFTPAAVDRLLGYDWPGNVRQLENEIQRAVLVCEGTKVDVNDLSINNNNDGDFSEPRPKLTPLEDVERNAIIQMLRETGGNKVVAARRLGIGRQTLYNKIKQYQIPA